MLREKKMRIVGERKLDRKKGRNCVCKMVFTLIQCPFLAKWTRSKYMTWVFLLLLLLPLYCCFWMRMHESSQDAMPMTKRECSDLKKLPWHSWYSLKIGQNEQRQEQFHGALNQIDETIIFQFRFLLPFVYWKVIELTVSP